MKQIINRIFDPETNETLIDLSNLDKLTIIQLEVLIFEAESMLHKKEKEVK